MVIEALSFKLALDFFTYLRKNKIYASGIRLDFYDRNKHEFTGFADVAAMQTYYEENYIPYDNCFLGDMVAVQVFTAESDIYNFTTGYVVNDVVGNFKVNQISSFDNQRNKERSILTTRQINFLNKTIGEYRAFYNEINRISNDIPFILINNPFLNAFF